MLVNKKKASIDYYKTIKKFKYPNSFKMTIVFPKR